MTKHTFLEKSCTKNVFAEAKTGLLFFGQPTLSFLARKERAEVMK